MNYINEAVQEIINVNKSADEIAEILATAILAGAMDSAVRQEAEEIANKMYIRERNENTAAFLKWIVENPGQHPSNILTEAKRVQKYW